MAGEIPAGTCTVQELVLDLEDLQTPLQRY